MTRLLTPQELESLKGTSFSLPRLFERGMSGRHRPANKVRQWNSHNTEIMRPGSDQTPRLENRE